MQAHEQVLLKEEFIDDGTGIETEDIESDVRITEPFDPSLIRVSTQSLTIDLLLSRLGHGELDLSPGFQRKGGIWKDSAQSRLIESILIRIPLPAFYMDATDENRWLVVDGLQRLTALKRFVVTQELRLAGLDFLVQFNGQKYPELPRSFQRRILETQVTVYLIQEGTPPTVKFNIFKRINTGGLPLSAQEIRHALNQGPVIDLLTRLAASPEFRRATANSIRDDRMADKECVLRFLAFCDWSYTQYNAQDFDGFLSKTMNTFNHKSDAERLHFDKRFRKAMKVAFNIFGDKAFRKQASGRNYRFPINKALFESWSVSLANLSEQGQVIVEKRRIAVNKGFVDLMSDRDFLESISQGTGDVAKVKRRFSEIDRLLSKVMD